MMDNLPRERPGSAEIAGLLRRDIEMGRFAINQRLPAERQLAEEYDVARGTIRDALKRLENARLVEIRPGSGTYIAYKSEKENNAAVTNARPLELIDARFALEPHICRLAVLQARKQDFVHAEKILAKMEDCTTSPHAFAAADGAFHNLLAEITGNDLIIWMAGQINAVRNHEHWSRVLHLTLSEAVITHYNFQHRQILTAIRTREPERAANLMKEHIETARLSLTRTTNI